MEPTNQGEAGQEVAKLSQVIQIECPPGPGAGASAPRRAFDAVGHLHGRPHVALERLLRPTLHDGKGGLVGGLYAQVLDGRAHEPVQGVGRKHGLKIKLQDQPFQILALLLEHPGEVVTREELQQKLWSADTFVDFDVGLNTAIKRLRDALGDTAEGPRYVETLPRRGYRFIASVEDGTPMAALGALPSDGAPPATQAEATSITKPAEDARAVARLGLRPRSLWGVALAAAVTLALLLALNLQGLRQRLRGKVELPKIQSIAVLPLDNLTGDPAQEYFVDGMTEALITDLGKIGELRVISRTSVMRYKGTKKSLQEIARELQVDALVEGTVARSGDRVRITANLVQSSPEKHLWADSFERDLRDVLALQDDVSRAIANGIQIRLTPHEQARLASAHPVNPEAYEAYVKGRYFMDLSRWPQGGLKKAGEYFQQAIEKDPTWAPAYSGLAVSYLFTGINLPIPNEFCPTKAKAAALEALKRDDAAAEAHSSVAAIEFWCNWNWPAVESEARRAIELNPSLAEARSVHGHYLVAMGRTNEGLAEMKRAVELDPISLSSRWSLEFSLYLAGRYDQAAEECRKMLQVDANFAVPHIYLGDVYVQKGDLARAIRELETAVILAKGTTPRAVAHLGYAYALAGRRNDAQNQLNELKERVKRQDVLPDLLAAVYVGLGQQDDAFAWLEKAYQGHSRGLINLRDDPHFASLRSDPRFADLVRRVGLPP